MRRAAPEGPERSGGPARQRGLRHAAAGLDGECRPPRVRGKQPKNVIAERDGPPRRGKRQRAKPEGPRRIFAARCTSTRCAGRRTAQTPDTWRSPIAHQRLDDGDGVGVEDFRDVDQFDDIDASFAAFAFRHERLGPRDAPGELMLAQARRLARGDQGFSQSQILFGVGGFSHSRRWIWRLRS